MKFAVVNNSNGSGRTERKSRKIWAEHQKPRDTERAVEISGVLNLELEMHLNPSLCLLESYSIAGSEGSISASAASGLPAPSGPSSGLSSGPCSPGPPGSVSGLRRWLDHSKHCLSVEAQADCGQTGPHEVSTEASGTLLKILGEAQANGEMQLLSLTSGP